MYRKKGRGWTKHIDFMLLDVLCMQIAFIVSYIWRFGPGNPYTDKDYRILAAAFLLIDFFVEIVSDAFKNVLKRGYLDELIATCKHVVLVEIITTFFLFTTQMGEIYSRMSYYIMIPIYILVSYLGRVVLKKIIKKRGFASSKKSLFVIAPEKLLEETLHGLKKNGFGYTQIVAAATDTDLKGKTICEIPIVANHDGIVDYACEEWVDEVLITVISNDGFASYDDSGKAGHKSCYILESGIYDFYVGNSVRNCEKVYSFTLESTVVTAELSEVMAVSENRAFERFAAVCDGDKIALSKEKVPVRTVSLKNRILSSLPDGKEISGDKGYKLSDVKAGKVKLQDFTAQLSLDELEAISRGEGPMNSSLGAKGNAGAFGGVLKSLREKGIPPIITTDGPSGIRLLSACSLMPCGTAIACSWDESLTEKLFTEMGKEMIKKGSDVLLAPGMNIHRNVLCGRNFEYYSEDPYLTGKTAAATVRGIQKNGVSACPKHFAGNNQEYNRNHTDDIVSERALREIYLKGFEICVKESSPHCIMTSYNKINGVWSHYNYELCTTVLRDEWHFGGMVMTDWWMRYAPSPEFPQMRDNAYRVRAQVDVLMPGFKTAVSKSGGNDGSLLETYGQKDGIALGELQRTANNVLRFILSTDKKLN